MIGKLVLTGFLPVSGIVHESLHKLHFILMLPQKRSLRKESRRQESSALMLPLPLLMVLVLLHKAMLSVSPTNLLKECTYLFLLRVPFPQERDMNAF